MTTKKVLTFKRGGVHPDDKKRLSNDQPIEQIPLPSELIVPLSQHVGAPATPLKKKGDMVAAGEKIGTASGFISANIHSPVRGTITDIRRILLANSVETEAFVIAVDGEEALGRWEEQPYDSLSGAQMLALVQEMGVVGAGGATFPTHVKLQVPKGKHVDALVINGVECEPYITADHRLMLEQTDLLLRGIMIAAKITDAKRVLVGIEVNKIDAIEQLTDVIAKKGYPIEVLSLKVKYPQGDEKQLLKAAIGREVPSGKLPIDVGAIVLNVGTVFAIYEAVSLRKPQVSRVVTVSGEAMRQRKNLLVPIGTKIADLVAYCGGFDHEPDKLISGGPMMGFAFFDDTTVVTKGTSGILAIDTTTARRTACISCGRCIASCPMGLHPTRLFRLIEHGRYEEAMKLHLMDCKECGCCAYSCPAHLPLVQGMKLGKKLGRK